MKKIKQIFNKKDKAEAKKAPTGRITKDTISEYRKEIIKEGRKFKYPLQYSQHKLVINTLLISLASLFLVSFFFIWQLYAVQNSSTLFFRVTQVVPLPVAVIDGQQVRFSDYLMRYRSERHYLETKEDTDFSTKDGERQAQGIKRQAMDDVVTDAYATKIARQKDLTVTREDARKHIAAQQQPGEDEISDQTLASVLQDYYGWSMREYERVIQRKLLTQKVRYAVDDNARKISQNVLTAATSSDTSLEDVAAGFKDNNAQFGSSGGLVPKNNRDGGLAVLAVGQEKGQVSQPSEIVMGDGYYIVKTLDITDTGVSYEYIKIPLTELEKHISSLRKEGKINYFINIVENEDEAGV